MLDNTVFYLSFAEPAHSTSESRQKCAQSALIADSNLIMQLLDDRGTAPYRTFSYISRFAEMLKRFKGDNFCAETYRRTLDGWTLHMIELPCGSNTYILEKDGALLFIDCGFACYAPEMMKILYGLFPDFDRMEKA